MIELSKASGLLYALPAQKKQDGSRRKERMNKERYSERLAWAQKMIAQKKQEGENIIGLTETREAINRRREEGSESSVSE